MRNISTAVRGHYDDDGYMWAIIIRRFCDIAYGKELRQEIGGTECPRSILLLICIEPLLRSPLE
jgi:hypothetical protein